MNTQVIILGGGVGGLWLLYELSKRNCDAVVIQQSTIGTHASIGNHRWLHSGAYFAAYSMKPVAEQCRESSEKLRQFCRINCKDAIYSKQGALLSFVRQSEFERVLNAVREFDIEPDALIGSELSIKEPTLNSGLLRFGLFIKEEFAFDATAVLRTLAQCCIERGGVVYPSSRPLIELSVTASGREWSVSDGRNSFTSKAIVCAAGVLNPEVLFRINGRKMPNRIESTPVAFFQQRLSEGLLLIDHKWMISPLSAHSVASGHSERKYIPEIAFDDEIARDLETKMTNYLPFAQESKVGCYTCHKLENSDDPFNKRFPAPRFGRRHFFWTEEQEDGLFTFYPGLFTTAPNAGQKFANFLTEQLGPRMSTTGKTSKIFPTIPTAVLRNNPTRIATHHSLIWQVSRFRQ